MLLASVLTTETVETWSRLAVFEMASQHAASSLMGHRTHMARSARSHGTSDRQGESRAGLSAVALDDVVDIPVWAAPDMTPLRPFFPRPTIGIFVDAVPQGVETRGPPARCARFIRPPLRAPPA